MTRAEVLAAVERIYAEHGHPDDWGVQVIYLGQMLEHLDAALAAQEDETTDVTATLTVAERQRWGTVARHHLRDQIVYSLTAVEQIVAGRLAAQEGDPAFIHARWHIALDDPALEEPGPIRDHIEQHDAEVLRAAAVRLLNTVDPLMTGPDVRMACVGGLRAEADRIAGDQ